ncbi:hypothetical protein BH24GEM1_BH24GEM1_01860 [soil metagenome]
MKDQEQGKGEGVYHVNDREGRVNARGEDLSGQEILRRVGLSHERYQLFPVKGNGVGAEILPEQVHHVKPGTWFRATLRGADFSCIGAPA